MRLPGRFAAAVRSRGLPLLLIPAVVLAGCTSREEVLPGDRYDLRELDKASEVLSSAKPAGPEDPVKLRPVTEVPPVTFSVEGAAKAISLPAARAVTSWPTEYQNIQHLMPHAQLNPGPLTRVWAVPVGAGNSLRERITATPVSDGSRIFVLDAQGEVSAVSPGGGIVWRTDVTPGNEISGSAAGGGLAVEGGRLYVTTGFGSLVALDAASGRLLWTQKFDAAVTAAPLAEGGIVYVVTGDGIGWAIDSADGRVLWQIEGTPAPAAVLGSGTPAIAGKSVLFPFASGELTAVLKLGGITLWTSSLAGQRTGAAYGGVGGIAGGPVVSGDTVYAATTAGRLAAIETASGARLWTALEGSTGPVTVAGGSLFLVSDQAKLMRLDAGDGSVTWRATLPLYEAKKIRKRKDVFVHYGPVLAGGRLIVASSDGYLREIAPASGALLRATELGDGAAADPIVVNGTLYVLTAKGVLEAFR